MLSKETADWLAQTALAHWMVDWRWAWPVCESLHFIGMALLVGTAAVFDLRLLGFMRGLPVAAAMQMRFWAGVGIVLNLVSGLLFFIAAPTQYMNNIAMFFKVGFLVLAVANIIWFEMRYGAELKGLPADVDTPSHFKLAGAVSMASWVGVLYFGRMLAFIGNAF